MDTSELTGGELESLFDEWIDASMSKEQRMRIEAQLCESREGRQLLEMHQLLRASAGEGWDADLTDRIIGRLPSAGPQVYRAFAELIVRAWEDLDLRERLRAAPRETLTSEGVDIPEQMEFRIVTADKVALPSAASVDIPLPAPGSPAIGAGAARRRLMSTEFAWFWGVPGREDTRTEATMRDALQSAFDRVGEWWRKMVAPMAPPQRFAYAAIGVAVLALAVIYSGMSGIGPEHVGTASGPGGALVAVIGVAAVVLIILTLYFRRG